MKIGLFCLTEHFEGTVHESIMEQLRLVELADELGFDEAWFGEHHFNTFSVIPDPASMIAYSAAKTKSIRLGTAGFLTPFYHPIRLAETVATLDTISQGRFNAGFAKGGFAPDTKHFGCDPNELRALMFETVTVIDELLHKDTPLSYQGSYMEFEDVRIRPKPLQTKVPFFIATFANPETIRFAAYYGYGLLMSQGATLEECNEAQKFYYSVAGFYPEIVLMRVFCIADSTEEAYRIARPSIDHFVKCMRAASSNIPPPKFNREHYDAILKEREAFFDGQKFFDNGIIGTEDQCIETIKTIQKELVNVHIVIKPSSSHAGVNRRMCEQFASRIRPCI